MRSILATVPQIAPEKGGGVNPIRQARKAAGLSQTRLAERLGVTGPCISLWESDTSSVPTHRLRALHKALAPHLNLDAYLAHAERAAAMRVPRVLR